jgi:hypothetical protein
MGRYWSITCAHHSWRQAQFLQASCAKTRVNLYDARSNEFATKITASCHREWATYWMQSQEQRPQP